LGNGMPNVEQKKEPEAKRGEKNIISQIGIPSRVKGEEFRSRGTGIFLKSYIAGGLESTKKNPEEGVKLRGRFLRQGGKKEAEKSD